MCTVPRKTDCENVLQGLDFILRHFEEQSGELFPRKIMTYALGYQKEVYSKDEAMQYFAESDYMDCRIRAYHDQSSLAKYLCQNEIAPDLIMMDIDRSHFLSNKAFETTLNIIKTNLHEEIGGIPTVLWSGNGYHIIHPIVSTVLENIVNFKHYEKSSEQFLRFAEYYLSDGKADSNHLKTISFANCLLRIPGSHNSKLVYKNNNTTDESTQVKVIQEWNGQRPNIRLLLGTFHAHLVDQKIKGLQKHDELNHRRVNTFRGYSIIINKISWIEKLLQVPLPDNRKYCIWRILAPYLVNVRKLDDDVSFSVILEWLEKCKSVKRLSFDSKYAIWYIKNARRIGYYPIKLNALKKENAYFYKLLEAEKNHYHIDQRVTT